MSEIKGVRSGRLASFMPITSWLRHYHRKWLLTDALAGIALAGLLIPEGMAYAGMVGVPPQAGLYAAMAGLFIYAVFGTSRQMSVAATSATAVMTYAAIASVDASDPGRYASLVAALVIMAGLMFLLAGVIRLGFISDFMARPVIKGFVFGLALLIIVRQIPKLLGTPKVSGGFFQMAREVIGSLDQTNMTTLTLGIIALLTLVIFTRFVPRVPGALAVLVLGIGSVTALGLDNNGVAIVGAVPGGLPRLSIPDVSLADLTTMFPAALGILLVAYAEGLGTARTFAARHHYDIASNQELKALGYANLASGLLGGIIVGGGLSGSAANESAGAKTELSTLVASAAVIATLLLLTPVFHNLPEVALGAIVIHAVRHMLDLKAMRRYASLRAEGPIVASAALLGVLIFDILPGLIIATGISLLLLLREVSRPRVAVLGRRPGTNDWIDSGHHPKAVQTPGTMVCRIDGVLFFADADYVRKHILAHVRTQPVRPQLVVLDLEMIPEIDITATITLGQLIDELRSDGVAVSLAEVRGPVRKMLKRDGITERLGADRMFYTIDEAVAGSP